MSLCPCVALANGARSQYARGRKKETVPFVQNTRRPSSLQHVTLLYGVCKLHYSTQSTQHASSVTAVGRKPVLFSLSLTVFVFLKHHVIQLAVSKLDLQHGLIAYLFSTELHKK